MCNLKTDNIEIANHFNQYFVESITNIVETIDSNFTCCNVRVQTENKTNKRNISILSDY